MKIKILEKSAKQKKALILTGFVGDQREYAPVLTTPTINSGQRLQTCTVPFIEYTQMYM